MSLQTGILGILVILGTLAGFVVWRALQRAAAFRDEIRAEVNAERIGTDRRLRALERRMGLLVGEHPVSGVGRPARGPETDEPTP